MWSALASNQATARVLHLSMIEATSYTAACQPEKPWASRKDFYTCGTLRKRLTTNKRDIRTREE